METAIWITAFATIIYTIGTFLLWHTTKKALEESKEAFKLNFLITLINTYRPIWGTSGHMHTADQEAYSNLKKETNKEFESLTRKFFPNIENEILSIIKKWDSDKKQLRF